MHSSSTASFAFLPGAPATPCREYTPAERESILAHHLTPAVLSTAAQRTAAGQAPVAVFVSGLPASGKTTAGQHALRMLGARLEIGAEQLVRVDCDDLRTFHQQFADVLKHPARQSYTELIPWFMAGSRFEHHVFRDKETGLMPRILAARVSFLLDAVLDSAANEEYVRHVMSFGYTVHLVHIHVDLPVAVARAEQRAYRTGRWTSAEFVASRQPGLQTMLPRLATLALSTGGSVVVLDNTAEAASALPAPVLRYCAPPPCDEEGGLQVAAGGLSDRFAGLLTVSVTCNRQPCMHADDSKAD